jgi:hypothetical protein
LSPIIEIAAGDSVAHAHARDEQMPEAGGESARCGRKAPDGDADADYALARNAVDQPADRQPHCGIEQPERQALKQRDLGIGQPQIGLDRVDHQAEDRAIDERNDIAQRQHRHREPAPRGRRPVGGGCGRKGGGGGHVGSTFQRVLESKSSAMPIWVSRWWRS